jgi:predicted Zn-dependent protease
MRPGYLHLVIVLLVCAACARNPVTGKRQLALVSERQEVELGQQARKEIIAALGLYPDPALQAYVDEVGQKLARSSERPTLPWSFEVLDDAAINAFALPGGPVFITRGLLTHLNSEAELAAVLGHEVGHITARHAVNLISKQQLAQVGLGVGTLLLPERLRGLGQVAGAGAGLLFLRYGRDAERQSDALAWDYALRHGYDVREMRDVFTTLARASEESGAGRVPQWLATHPEPAARVQAIEQRLREEPPPPPEQLTEGTGPLMARLQGVTFGADPRQGFFRGSAFLHPGLAFQVSFPPGWEAVNGAQAVTAVSPRQDAVVQLALVPGQTPEAAAQRFFSQRGVQRGQTAVGTLNSLPMVAAYFSAQVEEGIVAGLVGFVSHGGQTFQLIGYTAAQALPAHDAAFRAALGSFAPLTDPAALAVQPARLEVVTLAEALTVAAAHQRFPSTVTLETVALLNGVQPDTVLPAAATFKRVTGGLGAPAISSRPASPAASTMRAGPGPGR